MGVRQKEGKMDIRKIAAAVLALLLAQGVLIQPDVAIAEVAVERTLSDGTYAADGFQWSGGSGKLKGMECEGIQITGGQAVAEITILSGHYRYVKLDGKVYDPVYQTEEKSVFELPVSLNQSMQIQAMTDAMSQPHEITYTILVELGGRHSETDEDIPSCLGEVVRLEDAYAVPGLDYLCSLKIQEAKDFRIHLYENGFTVLEICSPTTTHSANSQEESAFWKNDEKKDFSDPADLYAEKILRYLVIPKDAKIPVGVEKELILVQKPIDAAYLDIDATEGIWQEPSILSRVFAVASSDQLTDGKKKEEARDIRILGRAGEVSMKELLLGKCDLALISSVEDDATWEKLTSDLSMLHIPLIPDCSGREETDAAKEEWEKVIRLLFDWKMDTGENG